MNWNSFQEALFAAHGIIPHTLKLGHPESHSLFARGQFKNILGITI
jgi:hypothetical protein